MCPYASFEGFGNILLVWRYFVVEYGGNPELGCSQSVKKTCMQSQMLVLFSKIPAQLQTNCASESNITYSEQRIITF